MQCTLELCPISESIFQYKPSLAANAAFLAIFAASGITHVLQLIFWRSYSFSIPMVLGCITEIIGYVGRLMLNDNPFNIDGFLIQICCITLAPAFYSAAIYFTIADIVRFFGPEASWIRPTHYAWIFIPCDIISLILQATGGGLASVAAQNEEDDKPGTNIMVSGLAFQVFSLLMFISLTLAFVWRAKRLRSHSKEYANDTMKPQVSRGRLALFAIPFSLAILTIFTRCVFRVAELSEGWDGDLIHDEATFIALEGA